MSDLYVLGARQRQLFLKAGEEWNLYEAALILRLDTESGAVETCVEYKSPPEAHASEHSSNIFKAGTLVGDTLYTCTSTEVLIFKLPDFEQIGYISLPLFNDLHHVTPSSDGNLLIVSTGLDMVLKVSLGGKVLACWSVLDEDPWLRFSRTVDYRKVESTKPHKSHPNYVFELDGDIWVTRFRQRDAVTVGGPAKRIHIDVQTPHDGLVRGDRIYFTTVDGQVVIANRQTLKVADIIDLKEINGHNSLLGWCRGILLMEDQRVWVGFSRVRKTSFTENVLWAKNIFRDGMDERPTHIALYDIPKKTCLQEFALEPYGMNIVFSIFEAKP